MVVAAVAALQRVRSAYMPGVTHLLTGRRSQSLGRRARGRRWQRLVDWFPNLSDMRVVDLGGEFVEWLDCPVRPHELVPINSPWHTERAEVESAGLNWVRPMAGDACDLPAALTAETFDLAFSNSVIEHLGGHRRRIEFADSVHALAEHHWVQTPNRGFPLEPHYLCPGLQFLPAAAQARLARHWPVGHMRWAVGAHEWPGTRRGEECFPLASDAAPLTEVARYHALRGALSIELLSAAQLGFYFPGSAIERERFGGLTKSLIAVR